jgi:LMBR1 domain-containing protein 1
MITIRHRNRKHFFHVGLDPLFIMELFLVIVLIVFIFVFMMVGLKMLWIYEQPEDNWRCGTILPKLTFMISITLACLMALILPLDVENERETGKGLEDMWSALYTIVLVVGAAGIPLAAFYYEAMDDIGLGKGSRLPFLLLRLLMLVVFVVVIVALLYSYANNTTVPVTQVRCTGYVYDSPQTYTPTLDQQCRATTTVYLKMQMRLSNYLIAITAFVGWWFLVVFGSVGLTALPLDLIYSYMDRPTKSDLQKYNAQKQVIGEQSRELAKFGKELQDRERDLRGKSGFYNSRQKATLQRDYNKFKQSVYLLEMEYKKIEISLKQHGENPVISMLKLIGGLLGFTFSMIWIVHCFLYIAFRTISIDKEPVSLFLNSILISLSDGNGYIGSFVLFVLISLYLLATVVKGALKFGMKLFCLPIFPLREGDTPLNSLLFNSLIILLSSAAIAHLTYLAFQDYAYASSAVFVFGTQVNYLDLYRYFFSNNVMVWIYCLLSIIACFFVVIYGRDKPAIKAKKKVEEMMELQGFREKDVKKAAKGSSVMKKLYDKKGEIKI